MLEHVIHKSYRNQGNHDVLRFVKGTGKVLDIGCGGGDNAILLKEKGFEVDGITISEIELNEATPHLRNGYIYNLENGLPKDVLQEKYDYIICSHVLEHICYPEKLLLDIGKSLKQDGKLIVGLPNLLHYKSRWELLKGNFNYQSAGIWDNTHFKWYSFESGAKLLEEYGFKIISKSVTGQLPAATLFSKFLSKNNALRLYNQIIKISPGFFGYQLLYVATSE